MNDIARWDLWDGQMSQSVSGLWVRYAAHEFEVERLATERDAAQAEVERLRIDAARYQWLRSSQTHKSVGCIEFGVWGVLLNGPELDAAVDRGMQASANESGRDE